MVSLDIGIKSWIFGQVVFAVAAYPGKPIAGRKLDHLLAVRIEETVIIEMRFKGCYEQFNGF